MKDVGGSFKNWSSRKRKIIISVIFLIVLLAGGAWVIGSRPDDFLLALSWPIKSLILVACLGLIQQLVQARFTAELVRPFSIHLTFGEWFGLAMANSLFNYLAPIRVGTGVKAGYLKLKHHLSISHFISSYAAINYLLLVINSALGILALVLLDSMPAGSRVPILIFLSAAMVAPSIVAFWLVDVDWEWLQKGRLQRMFEGWRMVRRDRRTVITLSLLVLGNTAVAMTTVTYGFHVLGLPLGLPEALLLTVFRVMSFFISLTPGGLGVQEAVTVLSLKLLGGSSAQGMALAVVIRATMLFWVFTLGPVFSQRLLKRSLTD